MSLTLHVLPAGTTDCKILYTQLVAIVLLAMNEPVQDASSSPPESEAQANKIIKRFGGRHLIFRTKTGGWWVLPKPYVLISSFRGPVWVFYGAGQIWVTHKKMHEISGWMVRAPRIAHKKLNELVGKLEPKIAEFTTFCNEHGIEGTLVVERKVIEFHWTFGDELDQERHKKEQAHPLETKFQSLCDDYLDVKQELDV